MERKAATPAGKEDVLSTKAKCQQKANRDLRLSDHLDDRSVARGAACAVPTESERRSAKSD